MSDSTGTGGSKKWSEHSADEQTAVWEKIAEVYEKAGHPAGLKSPSCGAEYVNILMANQSQESIRGISIEGEFSADKKELVDQLTAKCKEAVAGVEDAKVAIAAKVGVGSQFSTLTQVSKLDGGETEVKHEEGQVLLLDFWATWCPPCQGPMAHNQSMLEEHGSKWGGKVRLIGLSIDNDSATVKNHVESKKWTTVEHYHIRNGKCTADKDYGISGVPHVAIVDAKGKIVFKGHPANRKDLVQDFNDLLEGKEITGEGTQPAGGSGEGDAGEEAKTEGAVEAAQIEPAVAKFKELAKEHCLTDATKDAAAGMPRAFCVLVVEQKFDCKAKKLSSTMENYHVLVGPQEKINKVKEILAPFNDQAWKVTVREQAT